MLKLERVIVERYIDNKWKMKLKTGLFWYSKNGAIKTLFKI
jgi:hypothetical protein